MALYVALFLAPILLELAVLFRIGPALVFNTCKLSRSAISYLVGLNALGIQMLKLLCIKWKNRRKFEMFSEMPDWLVAFFGLSGFLIAGFYGYVLDKVVPDYLETANKIPFGDWGWIGWMLAAILAALGGTVWHFGSIAWRCNGILRDRWYK